MGSDGNECPVFCPTICPPDHMTCPGQPGPNGCPVADACIPMTGKEIIDYHLYKVLDIIGFFPSTLEIM